MDRITLEEKMDRKRSMFIIGVCSVVFFVTFIAFSRGARAASYPERTITLVVPFAPGGVTDLGARAFADALQRELKQTVVVVNKPGGGTTIAGNTIAMAKPDGYTLGFLPGSASVPEVYTYFNEAPYTSKDLKPAARVLVPVLAITVKADSPYNSLKDLVQAAKKVNSMKIATHGKSTLGYLVLRTVGKAEKVNFVDVPFAGDSQIVPAILGGHVPAGTPAYPAIKSLVEAKQLRVLALCLEKRADFAANVPTVTELGYKLAYITFLGVFAPKGTPDEIVQKLSDVSRKITQQADFQKKLNNMGIQVTYESADAFQKSLVLYKENLTAFFKAEGLVK
jgi:tripartite-type tricarboxylate transporter receptor subunit TctC